MMKGKERWEDPRSQGTGELMRGLKKLLGLPTDSIATSPVGT